MSAHTDMVYQHGYLRVPIANSVKKNKIYHFYANIDENFTSIKVGHGDGAFSLWLVVDNTNVTFYGNEQQGTAIAHGLTLSTYVDIILMVGEENIGTLIINTLGGQFKTNVQIYFGYKGSVFVTSNNNDLSNVYASMSCSDFNCPIWMFGDSYFTHTSENRTPYHLIKWGFTKYLLNAYAGADSRTMFGEFTDYVNQIGTPKYLVWCLGMNDGDSSSAINAVWNETMTMLTKFCEEHEIELILATIPNTPTINNVFKNNWVRNSGYRYIDFAKAVNAESANATWYPNTREDNVHPNENGAVLLALQVLKDFPEIELGID